MFFLVPCEYISRGVYYLLRTHRCLTDVICFSVQESVYLWFVHVHRHMYNFSYQKIFKFSIFTICTKLYRAEAHSTVQARRKVICIALFDLVRTDYLTTTTTHRQPYRQRHRRAELLLA